MHQAFAPALDQDEAVKGIDGDAVGLLEDRGEREAMAEKRLLLVKSFLQCMSPELAQRVRCRNAIIWFLLGQERT